MPAPSATQAGQGQTAPTTGDSYANPATQSSSGTSKPTYNPEGTPAENQAYYDEEYGIPDVWQDYLRDRLFKEIPSIAETFGEDPRSYEAFLHKVFPEMLGAVQRSIQSDYLKPLNLTASPQGFEFIYGIATNWLSSRDGRLAAAFDNRELWATGGRGSGGGGRGGPVRPTAEQIRAQFDLDELAAEARDVWRSTVLDEPTDARGMASAYVEAIVQNPDQRLDFKTFIEKQAEGTARYVSLYRNKPPGMTPAQYLMPYLNTAQQMARPKEAVNIAAGGAQLGADPAAFRSRLNRTNANTTSAPFISSLESRMTGLKRVLKG